MRTTILYHDITELGQLHSRWENRYGIYAPDSPKSLPEALAQAESKIQTPIAFAHQGADYNGYFTGQSLLEDAGWKLITTALNWHKSHLGDHGIRIWMKEFPHRSLTGPIPSWRPMYPCHRSFVYGCGGRLLNRLTLQGWQRGQSIKLPYAYRYLTILRFPVDQKFTAAKLKYLEQLNFRRLVQTDISQLWVNGFTDWSKGRELEFWEKWKLPKHPAIRKYKPAKKAA